MITADAQSLPFQDCLFDFVLMFRVLEHIPCPDTALGEAKRVLRQGGWLYVGVPNKARLIGYLGSAHATLRQKIAWNMKDYTMRLRGRFENSQGAHAGFEARELSILLETYFRDVQLMTPSYLRWKYHDRLPRLLLDALLRPDIIYRVAPAHYALCRKEQSCR